MHDTHRKIQQNTTVGYLQDGAHYLRVELPDILIIQAEQDSNINFKIL
jgi:hypothetical protein